MTDKNCISNALAKEFERIAVKHGIIPRVSEYPALARMVASDCDCGGGCAADKLEGWIATFDRTVVLHDGFELGPDMGREALKHYLFGAGSVILRRDHIVINILGIEQDDKDEKNYRRGYDQGTFKRAKLPQLLRAFAKHILEIGNEAEEAA